jgi:hypothetical protein
MTRLVRSWPVCPAAEEVSSCSVEINQLYASPVTLCLRGATGGKALAKLEGLLAAFLGPGRDPEGSDTLGSEGNPKGRDRPRGVPGLLHCVAQLQELNPQQVRGSSPFEWKHKGRGWVCIY